MERDLEGQTNANSSDPTVNRDQLPEDSPVFLLEEARQAFRAQLPPFVVKKRSQPRRRCVIPTVNGTRAMYPTTIDLVPRLWDNNHVYWTVDMNCKRYIVKSFPGDKGLGGAKYLPWTGLEKGFHEKPLALSQFSSTYLPPKASRRRHTENIDSSRPSGQEINDPIDTNAGSRDFSSCSASNFALRPIVNNSGTNQTLTKNALSKGKRPTRHSELPARTSHDSSQGSEESSKRRRLDISSREIKRLQAIAPPPPRQPNRRNSGAQIPAPQKQSTLPTVQPPASTSTGLFSNLFNEDLPTLPSQSLQPSASSHATPRPPSEPITRDQDKLNRTTLVIRVAPLTEYTPLKLSECSSLATFFSKTIGVWNLREEDVARIKIVFKWKHVDDPMRVMVMNHNQACFAHMLDEIEDAPVWSGDKRKCLLDVEIVMKHETDV